MTPSILRVNKLIAHEANGLIWERNTFFSRSELVLKGERTEDARLAQPYVLNHIVNPIRMQYPFLSSRIRTLEVDAWLSYRHERLRDLCQDDAQHHVLLSLLPYCKSISRLNLRLLGGDKLAIPGWVPRNLRYKGGISALLAARATLYGQLAVHGARVYITGDGVTADFFEKIVRAMRYAPMFPSHLGEILVTCVSGSDGDIIASVKVIKAASVASASASEPLAANDMASPSTHAQIL